MMHWCQPAIGDAKYMEGINTNLEIEVPQAVVLAGVVGRNPHIVRVPLPQDVLQGEALGVARRDVHCDPL